MPLDQKMIGKRLQLPGEHLQKRHTARAQLGTPTLEERAAFILYQLYLQALSGHSNLHLLGELAQVGLFKNRLFNLFFIKS